MSMRFGCCCTTGDRCLDCEPVEEIACVKVTRSGWAQPRVVKGTWTELCGHGVALGSPCGIPEMGVSWKPDDADCNIVLFTLLFRGFEYTKCAGAEGLEEEIAYPELRVVFSAPRNWYLTSASTTIGSETITVEVGDVALDTDISKKTHPATYLYIGAERLGGINARGNTLCGDDCQQRWAENSSWLYDIWTDKIVVTGQRWFSGQWSPVFIPPAIHTLCAEIDYDNGDWILTDWYPATTTETVGIAGATTTNTFADTVLVVDSCDYVPPPPCGGYTCFPDCLVKSCDGTTPSPYALFLDVTSLNDCCLESGGTFTWTGGGYYSGKIGDEFLVTCGYVEIWYECVGDQFRRRVKVTDVNGGTSESTENGPGACSGTPENFIDSFTVPSSFFTPLCFNLSSPYTDTVTFDIYTNN